ncbi:MAG: BTAD domain-containing putative transcriptional regulator [Anaerolineae bacterium]
MGVPNWHIQLFGPLKLVAGDHAPEPNNPGTHQGQTGVDARLSTPASPTAQSLLAYLILYHERAISRERLASVFSPERSAQRARRALSHALWQIRRALGPAGDRIVTKQGTVTFALHPGDQLDVEQLEEVVRPAVRSSDISGDSIRRLEDAAALYRADFMSDYYDDWALVKREQLRELYLHALERLIALHKRRSDHKEALNYAQRLAAADPLREAAHRELMRLYHLLGRPRAALEQFEALHDLLAEELGVEPSTATIALRDEVLVTREDVEPPHLPVLAPPPPLLRDLGNRPDAADERLYVPIALLGQVLVTVRGTATPATTSCPPDARTAPAWRCRRGRSRPSRRRRPSAAPSKMRRQATSRRSRCWSACPRGRSYKRFSRAATPGSGIWRGGWRALRRPSTGPSRRSPACPVSRSFWAGWRSWRLLWRGADHRTDDGIRRSAARTGANREGRLQSHILIACLHSQVI